MIKKVTFKAGKYNRTKGNRRININWIQNKRLVKYKIKVIITINNIIIKFKNKPLNSNNSRWDKVK